MDDTLPTFHQRTLLSEQLAMMDLLGSPEIIGANWTPLYLIAEDDLDAHPMIAPPYAVTYLCPVVIALGKPRAIQPNGDLREVEPDNIDPANDSWFAAD